MTLSVKVTPPGRLPDSLIVMLAPAGKPVDVTVNIPALPVVKVVLFALVMVGEACMVTLMVMLSVPPFPSET